MRFCYRICDPQQPFQSAIKSNFRSLCRFFVFFSLRNPAKEEGEPPPSAAEILHALDAARSTDPDLRAAIQKGRSARHPPGPHDVFSPLWRANACFSRAGSRFGLCADDCCPVVLAVARTLFALFRASIIFLFFFRAPTQPSPPRPVIRTRMLFAVRNWLKALPPRSRNSESWL